MMKAARNCGISSERLFGLMNNGGTLSRLTLPEINGGLFAPDPLIDGLNIPNHVFVKAGQGANEASLESDPKTLFYLCGRYNYAGRGDVKESLSLYTLGHIFEQSITELEYREGELEKRETVAKLSKRKRDGVYYTAEPVVNYLVEQTLGPWFADAKTACGYPQPEEGAPTVAAAEAYVSRLKAIRIVDPACSSGAFLICVSSGGCWRSGLRRQAMWRGRGWSGARPGVIDEAPLIAHILRENIHGVDINPASVEIAKLALWLHSARASAPLSSLERTIRIGNSLVGEDSGPGRQKSAQAKERVRTCDSAAAFPGLTRGPKRRIRYRARQSALCEAAESHEGGSGRSGLSSGGTRNRDLAEALEREISILSAVHREGPAAARAGRTYGVHRAKPMGGQSVR